MSGKFAKLFELNNDQQVVMHKSFNSREENSEQICFLFCFKGDHAKSTLSYKDAETRDKAFEELDQEKIQNMHDAMYVTFFSDVYSYEGKDDDDDDDDCYDSYDEDFDGYDDEDLCNCDSD